MWRCILVAKLKPIFEFGCFVAGSEWNLGVSRAVGSTPLSICREEVAFS